MHANFAVAAAAAAGVHRASVLQECHESMCCNPWDIVHPQRLSTPGVLSLSEQGVQPEAQSVLQTTLWVAAAALIVTSHDTVLRCLSAV